MQSESEQPTCDICESPCRERRYTASDAYFVRCSRCGDFYITDEAILALRRVYSRHVVSGFCRELCETSRGAPTITTEHLATAEDQIPGDFAIAWKVRKLLGAIARKSEHAGAHVEISDSVDISLAFAKNIGEFIYLTQYAVDRRWVSKRLLDRELAREDAQRRGEPIRDWEFTLLPEGWEELQAKPRNESRSVFVAMSFDASLTCAYTDGIRPAIEEDCHWKAIRVDMEEHNRDIVDKILGDLRECRFVVVDVTISRPAVYFEAGFALGLGIPIIWSCRKDVFEDQRNRNFDTEHFNHILWETPKALRTSLANRVRATIPFEERRPR